MTPTGTMPSYLWFRNDLPVHRTWQVSDSVLVDLAEDGTVIGIENLLDANFTNAMHAVLVKFAKFTGPLSDWPEGTPA